MSESSSTNPFGWPFPSLLKGAGNLSFLRIVSIMLIMASFAKSIDMKAINN